MLSTNLLRLKILLQLLVLQLALQLLGLGHLAHRLVKVVLVDSFPIILDGEQTTRDRVRKYYI